MGHRYNDKAVPAFKKGTAYGKDFMLPCGTDLKKAMMQHEQHHYPESALDGKTVPYSIMDDKHKGRR